MAEVDVAAGTAVWGQCSPMAVTRSTGGIEPSCMMEAIYQFSLPLLLANEVHGAGRERARSLDEVTLIVLQMISPGGTPRDRDCECSRLWIRRRTSSAVPNCLKRMSFRETEETGGAVPIAHPAPPPRAW